MTELLFLWFFSKTQLTRKISFGNCINFLSFLVLPAGILLFTGSTASAKLCTQTEINQFRKELSEKSPNSDSLERAANCVENIEYSIEVLNKPQQHEKEYRSAAYTIASSGKENVSRVIDDLLLILRQGRHDALVRKHLVSALGTQDPQPKIVETLLQVLLTDPDGENRGLSALVLSDLHADSGKVLPNLLQTLQINHPSKQDYVYEKTAFAIAAYGIESEAYLDDLQQLVKLQSYTPDVQLAIAKAISNICEAKYENSAKSTVHIYTIWSDFNQLRQLSKEFGEVLQILDTPELAVSYRQVERYKKLVDGAQRDLILSLGGQGLTSFYRIATLHSLFWLTLIFVYPRSPMVQTVFFWTPRIRKILGFPYVTAMLKWVPPLRRILFIPFQDSLRSDANLDLFNLKTYFVDLRVKAEEWTKSKLIGEVIPQMKGQIVLQGESGSGKSMFLRYLLMQSSRISVYLPAQKCEKGVIAAIQAKLYGQAQDADFLRDLIYAGAINIYIDGLNEVTPDTRASIKEFVEKNFKGNIILTTQPLENWKPPGKVYNLQSLNLEQISTFLYQHCPDNPDQNLIYKQTCANYLQTIQADLASDCIPEDEKVTLQQSLSNPMDLTVVAQLLASRKQPNLLRLREQQYTTMAEDYQQIHLGRLFPLASFSEMAYQQRLQSQAQILETDFAEELLCLERHKMVVSRQKSQSDGSVITQWFFRHEKVADYFVAQAFLQATDDRQTQHFGDSRFRGVYLLLAVLLPYSQKMALREELIQYAVRNNNHTLSDSFIQMVGSLKLPLPT